MAITSVFQTEEMGSIPIIRWSQFHWLLIIKGSQLDLWSKLAPVQKRLRAKVRSIGQVPLYSGGFCSGDGWPKVELHENGSMPEWLKGVDCKSTDESLHKFESYSAQ